MAQIRNRGNGHYQIMVSMGYDSKGKKLQKTASYTVDPKQTPRQQEKALQAFAAAFEANPALRSRAAYAGRKRYRLLPPRLRRKSKTVSIWTPTLPR